MIKEYLTVYQYTLIVIIFCTAIAVNLDEKFKLSAFFKLPVLFSLSMSLSLALQGIFLQKAINLSNYWTVTLWVNILNLFFLIPTYPLFKKSLRGINIKQIGSTAVVALMGMLAILAEIKAFATNVSISSTIISLPLSMLIAFMFSVFTPQLLEKHTLKIYAIRFTAAIVMISAALKLTY